MFFFAPFTNSIMCGMRAQYITFPSYKKRTVLAPVGFCYFVILFSKPSKAFEVKKQIRGELLCLCPLN